MPETEEMRARDWAKVMQRLSTESDSKSRSHTRSADSDDWAVFPRYLAGPASGRVMRLFPMGRFRVEKALGLRLEEEEAKEQQRQGVPV